MKQSDIKKIAVIGAGDMGHGIAEVCAMSGCTINLYDITQEFVDNGKRKITQSLEKQVAKQKMSQDDFNQIIGSIHCYTSLKEAVSDIDLMIEAAPEVLDLKKKIFREADGYAPKDAILASNTSSMSITGMAEATGRPDQVAGIHFFNPPAMMKLVEVIRGDTTSDDTMNICYEFIEGLNNFRGAMVPVRVEKDTPGFIFNRVNAPVGLYMAELYDKGFVDPEAVDAKIRSTGAPMGPYELMDYTGLDINLNGMEYSRANLSPEFKPSGWLKKLNEAGKLGKKTGEGIYKWPGGARPVIDMSKADPNFDVMDVVCLQVNEGTKLLEAGVAVSAAEIDKAMIYGGGNAFGPFTLAKDMGWQKVAERCEAISNKLGIKWFLPTETLKKGDIQL
ncbi:MAG: 3-hydroxyacyl-CoA dehydrogenase [Syntrophales bacterium]|jgi:enoyl-CoA hydratase/3-hydroxyacyl-CoA dehydrogenase|nr:3-hydroxyacyl-CoA dehydrogenase [Syntrophales bacterium]MDY0043605.1 3-hydroxyacyl-CoA dehydrogenase NAD-binding domain-containing protein [Syntrophales bacterium]